MGSSAKKKREKKKDFQVRHVSELSTTLLMRLLETKAESWKSTTKSSQSNRYQLPIKRLDISHHVVQRANDIP